MAGRACIGGGAFLLLVGLLLAIFGSIFIPPGLNKAETKGIKENIVVDSTKASVYSDWAGGYDEKQEYQMVFHFYNLTNVEEVRKGAKPSYTIVGPYVYRRYRTSINVSFEDNGNVLKYSNLKDYTFDRNNSVGPDTDLFVNINHVYLAALAQTQNELGMLTALAPAYIQEGIDFLTGDFISLFSLYVSSTFLSPKVNATISKLAPSFGGDLDKATLFFFETWANATTAPDIGGDWTGLLISASGNISSGVSLNSALALFDPDEEYSLLSDDAEIAWKWQHALEAPDEFLRRFYITYDQLAIILAWRNTNFAPTFIHPFYVKAYDLGEIADLGWLQWFDGTPLNGRSSNDVWQELANPLGAEWEFFSASDTNGDNTFISWEFSKKVMNRETGLTNLYVYQDWLLAQTNGTTDFAPWGLTVAQSDNLFSYVFQLGYGYGIPALLDLYGNSGGLFRTKSVLEWVFDCNEYILPILQPDAMPCGMLVNHTYFPRTSVWSGKDDVKKINTYIEWRGMANITGIWAGPLDVTGSHTELGQFQPDIKGEPLLVFDPNLVRPLTMVYNTSSSVKGIKTKRYLLDWQSVFKESEFFYQSIFGLANMTSFEEGSPIFLSLWDLMGVENRTDYVDGLITPTSEYDYNTVIEVEPKTGNSVQSHKRIQINVYIPPEASSYFLFSPWQNNPRTGIVYPMMKAGEYVTISDDLAKDLKKKLGLVPKLKKVFFWLCVIGGPTLFLIGLTMIVIGHRKSKMGYEAINN